jgi:hypothetical protein
MKPLPEEIIASSVVSENGDHGWRDPDIFEALEAIAGSGQAIFGGDIWLLEEDTLEEPFPEITSIPFWETDLREPEEPWSDYCHRTCEQSIREIKENQIEKTLEEKLRSHVAYHPHYSEEDDPRYYIPRSKIDVERAGLAVKAGYPVVAPILFEFIRMAAGYELAGGAGPRAISDFDRRAAGSSYP